MGDLLKGVFVLPQGDFETAVNNNEIDDDVLYVTPEDVSELVRTNTRKIALNEEEIANNKQAIALNTEAIDALKNASGGSSEDLTEIKNTIQEIILRDTNQDSRLTVIENDYAKKIETVTLDGAQRIIGPKTFTEHIYLANADGTVDRISHLNNNFIVHSGATNSAVLNIDEGLEKIYAFNNELAFKSDIAEAAGTTIYVDGTAVANLSFNADPQTQINLLSEGLEGDKAQLNTKVSKSGDTMTGELIASAGVAFGNNKIKAENSGNTFEIVHLENNVEKNIFNYTHGGIFTLNNSETPLIVQGSDDRPSYVSGSGVMSDLALESDIPTKVSQLTNDSGYAVASDVDGKIAENLTTAKSYTDSEIAALIDSAPETRDTLAELAKAIQDNETVVDALNAAIGNKADKTTVEALTSRVSTNETNIIDLQNNKVLLYSTTGQNIDGAMTQKAITDELELKIDSVDVNLDAINFADEEREKSLKNLFQPYTVEETTLSDTTSYVDFINHFKIILNTTDSPVVSFTRSDSYDNAWRLFCKGAPEGSITIKAVDLKPNTIYTFSYYTTSINSSMFFLDKELGFRVSQQTITSTFTTDENGEYVWVNGFWGILAANAQGNVTISNIQLEEGDFATEYTPYYGPIIHKNDLTNVDKITADGTPHKNQNDVVVEYYVSSDGLTWYKKWASGWKVCGGYYNNTNLWNIVWIQFPIKITDVKNVQVTPKYEVSDQTHYPPHVALNVTNNNNNIVYDLAIRADGSWGGATNNNGVHYYWEVKGY